MPKSGPACQQDFWAACPVEASSRRYGRAVLRRVAGRWPARRGNRHCEPTGRANARPMTGSAKQSSFGAAKEAGLLRRSAPRNDGWTQLRVPAASFARGFIGSFRPLQSEGAGNAGRPMRPLPRVQVGSGNAHALVRSHRNHPAFPTQWLYGFLRALPGDRLSCRRHQRKLPSANLTPAPGRQDHTTSPSALASPVKRAFASIASRSAFRDVAQRPSEWRGTARK
jgi:hypothetical protein